MYLTNDQQSDVAVISGKYDICVFDADCEREIPKRHASLYKQVLNHKMNCHTDDKIPFSFESMNNTRIVGKHKKFYKSRQVLSTLRHFLSKYASL